MKLLSFGKSTSPPVAGAIACLGLTDWWLKSLSETERANIRQSFKPMGSDPGFAIDKGETTCEGQRAAKFLGVVAGWVRKDVDLELKILSEAERRASYVLDQHFIYQHLIEYWYRLREKREDARVKAIAYCERQIAISKSVSKEYRRGDRDLIAMCKKAGANPPKFDGRMPSHTGFTQLSIIREKDGDFAEAIRICQQAKRDGWAGDWDKRIARLGVKRAKTR